MSKWGLNWATGAEWKLSLDQLSDTEELVRKLKASNTVESLYIAVKGGCIDDDWLDQILGALEMNQSLKILKFNCHSGPGGWQNFCDVLKRNTTLEVLDVVDAQFG